MYSFQSVNTEADANAWCEHSFTGYLLRLFFVKCKSPLRNPYGTKRLVQTVSLASFCGRDFTIKNPLTTMQVDVFGTILWGYVLRQTLNVLRQTLNRCSQL